jgi:hypothetical protein
VIGHAVADPEKTVRIPQRKLTGRHKSFWSDEHATRRRRARSTPASM